jgi:phosphohistidine phosphatase
VSFPVTFTSDRLKAHFVSCSKPLRPWKITMKTLLLLRHAKSSAKDSDIDDHERPLNKRGKREAPRIGCLVRDEHLMPDLIVSSSAKRCRKTADRVIESSGYRGETRFTSELYEANADRIRQFLISVSAGVDRVLLVGHNPGLEEFLENLTGNYTPLSTGALAHVELPIEAWRDVTAQTRGNLQGIWQPGELED